MYSNNKYTNISEFDTSYHFFKSIFDFVLTGFLDTKNLSEEITSYSFFRKNKNSFQSDSPLNQLNSFDMLSNEEFNQNVVKVYEAIENGNYVLGEFTLAFVRLSKLSTYSLISDSIQELEVFFEKNIDKSLARTKKKKEDRPNPFLDINEKINPIAPNLYKKIISFEGEIFSHKQNSEAEIGFQNLKKTIDDLNTLILVLQKIDPERISEYIFEHSNDRKFIKKFYFQVKEVFKGSYLRDRFSNCLPKLILIRQKIQFYIDDFSIGKIDKFWLNEIEKLFEETIRKLEDLKL